MSPRTPRERPAGRASLVGTEWTLDVGAVAHGGHCVARHEGQVVFVRHALPGERVLARVTEGRVKIEFPATSLAPPPGQWEVMTQGIADGAYIFNPFAQDRLLLPQIASNLTFGGAQRNHLFVTATSTLYSLRLNINGLH